MSWYRIVVIFVFVFVVNSCSAGEYKSAKSLSYLTKTQASADFYYISGLDCEYRFDYACSANMFERLYNLTHQVKFLKRMARLALLSGKYKLYKRHIKTLNKLALKDNEIASYLIPYYLKIKNYKKAEKLSKKILKSEKSIKNYQLLAALYIDMKKYKKADKILDEYIKENGCEPAICGMKLVIKTKEEDVDGTIKLLKKLYQTTKNQTFELELLRLLVVSGRFDELDRYVYKSKTVSDDVLLDIYLSIKNYKKAEKVALKLYKKSKNLKYLADAAIYLYEARYQKDHSVLKKVIDRFKKSVDKVKKAMYYNYYGYLLIDHNKNIKEGIRYVKKALKLEPKNEYYLDSLAWGYYKMGRCKEALDILQNLKDKDQEEIKEHIKKVKGCLKR